MGGQLEGRERLDSRWLGRSRVRERVRLSMCSCCLAPFRSYPILS